MVRFVPKHKWYICNLQYPPIIYNIPAPIHGSNPSSVPVKRNIQTLQKSWARTGDLLIPLIRHNELYIRQLNIHTGNNVYDGVTYDPPLISKTSLSTLWNNHAWHVVLPTSRKRSFFIRAVAIVKKGYYWVSQWMYGKNTHWKSPLWWIHFFVHKANCQWTIQKEYNNKVRSNKKTALGIDQTAHYMTHE